MDLYDQVKKQWQIWSVRSGEDLDLRLNSFRILFAYNSGKIENAEISYHDTREIFENGRVVGYILTIWIKNLHHSQGSRSPQPAWSQRRLQQAQQILSAAISTTGANEVWDTSWKRP